MEVSKIWSKYLTNEEIMKLEPMLLNDKDITTDFDFLHHGNYLENENTTDNIIRECFYNNNCLWELEYKFGGDYFLLECVYVPNEASFNKSYEYIKDRLFECTTDEDEFSPIVSISQSTETRCLIVRYYSLEI